MADLQFTVDAPTDAERAAALDAELNADLGEYDQRLLREQEREPHRLQRLDGTHKEGFAFTAGLVYEI